MLDSTESMFGEIVIPVRARGCTRLCVSEYGAKGDGVTDDTDAFQRAIDSLPASGGEVHVPDGRYLIDSTRSLRLRSFMLLNMDANAVLMAMPNTKPRDYVLLIENVEHVEVRGGTILGDRASFVEQPGTTSEWGHAIAVFASKAITISDITLMGCVGDGISVGGRVPVKDLFISGVVADGNRRQGLSLVNVDGAVIYRSVFSDTNGTSPECGIDVEPEARGYANNIDIVECKLSGNAKYGIHILQRSDGGKVTNVTLRNCDVSMNSSNGVVTTGVSDIRILDNRIYSNRATGLRINDTSNIHVEGNVFKTNYTSKGIKTRTPFEMVGYSNPKTERDILVRGDCPNLTFGINRFE